MKKIDLREVIRPNPALGCLGKRLKSTRAKQQKELGVVPMMFGWDDVGRWRPLMTVRSAAAAYNRLPLEARPMNRSQRRARHRGAVTIPPPAQLSQSAEDVAIRADDRHAARNKRKAEERARRGVLSHPRRQRGARVR